MLSFKIIDPGWRSPSCGGRGMAFSHLHFDTPLATPPAKLLPDSNKKDYGIEIALCGHFSEKAGVAEGEIPIGRRVPSLPEAAGG